ncbi:helix-turn-helix domain-containing protein [Phaeobacter marinintestinus]|uniref:helix-turn-helix domain-containing protein n=1 Tax=Falsiphaeobacter marinintestinus TaxID=1492905 RepID=UPI0011B36AD6|nr:AraC family transcriptional regulator [Phaeobacter marinintestinus]
MSRSLPLVRLHLLAPLLTGLRNRGVDPEPVLESVGLTVAAVDQDDISVHVMVMHQFVESCATAVDDQTFCAEIGSHLDPSGWPMVRQAFEDATTLGDFLNIYVANAHKYASSATPYLEVRGETATFGEARTFKPLIKPAQNDGFMIGLKMAILKRALGDLEDLERVLLVLCDPSVLPASFDRNQTLKGNDMGPRIQFPSEWLSRSITEGVPETGTISDRREKQHSHFLTGFRKLLRQKILDKDMNASKAADLVHMAPRSLARRLAVWDTNISRELARAKVEYAKDALEGSGLSVEEIASNLGYTNPSNFARAFAREEGMSPTKFRAERKARQDGLHV